MTKWWSVIFCFDAYWGTLNPGNSCGIGNECCVFHDSLLARWHEWRPAHPNPVGQQQKSVRILVFDRNRVSREEPYNGSEGTHPTHKNSKSGFAASKIRSRDDESGLHCYTFMGMTQQISPTKEFLRREKTVWPLKKIVSRHDENGIYHHGLGGTTRRALKHCSKIQDHPRPR